MVNFPMAMFEENYKILLPIIVALLIIWLIYRIKHRIRAIVKNEIFNNFPLIRDEINNFEHRLGYLNTQIELLERKLSNIKGKNQDSEA